MNKSILAILLVAGYATASANPEMLVTKEMVEIIKSKTSSWTPFEHEAHPFKHLTKEQAKKRLGLITPSEHSLFSMFGNKKAARSEQRVQTKPKLGLPTSFDARTQWPTCIGDIRDQGSCGSCWAFASAGFLGDRFCIASSGSIDTVLSPQDMIDCDFNNGGCNGGFLTASLNYLITDGIVSDTCLPYSSYEGYNGYCGYRCSDITTTYEKYACKYGSLELLTSAEDIQTDLYNNGPLMVGFTVYDDFMYYSSGVYERTSDSVAGGHAVKLIGWGYDASSNLYWVCQNQWGDTWGVSGYFSIYANQCGLDSVVYGCTPDIN